MSWESIFRNVENVIRLLTLVVPIIDFIETIFRKAFPKVKMGHQKKEIVMEISKLLTAGIIPEKDISEMVDGIVKYKNESGEYTHSKV